MTQCVLRSPKVYLLVSRHNKGMWNILLLELEIKYFPPIFLTQFDNNRHRICEKERKTNKVYCKDSSIASHIIVVANYWATLVQWGENIFEAFLFIYIFNIFLRFSCQEVFLPSYIDNSYFWVDTKNVLLKSDLLNNYEYSCILYISRKLPIRFLL